jgi:hypothetical protein
MKKSLALSVIVGLAGLTAGCSSGGQPAKTVAQVEVPTTATSTTTTTMAPTTTTTVCVVADAAGAASRLQSNQAQLDSLISGRRTAESAVAQIQLVVDNAGRSIEQHRRNQADAQKAYNEALAASNILGTDSSNDKLSAAADNLADWKGIVASWEATRTKALGDLARGKANLADWDKEIAEGRRAIATNRAAQTTLTCS